jgi:hypothetical protein
MNRFVLLIIGAVVLVVGLIVNFAEFASGIQPWGQTLGDNFLLARSLPFIAGFGVVVGLFRAGVMRVGTERKGDAVRRFAPSTLWLHWGGTLAVLVGLATGSWQYLKGLLDVSSPVPMPLVYRLHYIAATVLVFVLAVAITDWSVRREDALGVPKGQWIRALRGLARELPRPLGASVGYVLGLDLRRAPPPADQFTYYERVVSFPTWVIALGLITLTGILKAMRYIYPIPGDVLYWVSALHVSAMVLLAIKVLDHLRYVLAPSRWPLMMAMLTGWISARYVQLFHAGWQPAEPDATVSAPTPSPEKVVPA